MPYEQDGVWSYYCPECDNIRSVSSDTDPVTTRKCEQCGKKKRKFTHKKSLMPDTGGNGGAERALARFG